MRIHVGIDEATITEADGCIWEETFSHEELTEMIAEMECDHMNVTPPLESLMRRLIDMLWALTNDSDACIVSMKL